MIEELFDFYLQNQDQLVRQYEGKYLVITKDGVASAWDSTADKEAFHDAKSKYGMGNFILQLCTPGTGAYTFFNHHIASHQRP